MSLQDLRNELELYENKLLELIKKRIVIGEKIAIAKYPYIKHKLNSNNSNILELITNYNIEKEIYKRLEIKANDESLSYHIKQLYKDYIIPETKKKKLQHYLR